MNCFMYILDVAAYNSFVLFSTVSPDFKTTFKIRSRRKSLELLAKNLLKPAIQEKYEGLSLKNFASIKGHYFDALKANDITFNNTKSFSTPISPLSSPSSSPKANTQKQRCTDIESANDLKAYKHLRLLQ